MMTININRTITQSLQKQLDQVTMQHNENVMEGELLFASDATKFHILKKNTIYHAKNTQDRGAACRV
jgi:hypothetical protein